MDSSSPRSPPSRRNYRGRKIVPSAPQQVEEIPSLVSHLDIQSPNDLSKSWGDSGAAPSTSTRKERDVDGGCQTFANSSALAHLPQHAPTSSRLIPVKPVESPRRGRSRSGPPTQELLQTSQHVSDDSIPSTHKGAALHSKRRNRSRGGGRTSDSATSGQNPYRSKTRKVKTPRKDRSRGKGSGKIWPQVDFFGTRRNGVVSDHEGGDRENSVDWIQKHVVPLSTAMQREREARGEESSEGDDDDEGERYERAMTTSTSRRPLKRMTTFLGEQALDELDQDGRDRIVRYPPYRRKTRDVVPLELVPPSQAGLGGSFDPHPHSIQKAKDNEPNTKRRPAGQAYRTPFLTRLSQTAFAPLAVIPQQSRKARQRPPMRKLTDVALSDSEVARMNRVSSRSNGVKRSTVGQGRARTSKKPRLELDAPYDDLDMIDRDPKSHTTSHFRKRHKPHLTVRRNPHPVRYKFIPARLPKPIRPFAHLAQNAVESLSSETIQTRTISPSLHLPPSLPPPPVHEDPNPRPPETKFRFVVGPKAKKPPTVLVEDTPTQLASPRADKRPKRHITLEESAPQWHVVGHEEQQQAVEAATNPPPPQKKTRLMRRLSTLPDFQLNAPIQSSSKRVEQEENIVLVDEPNLFNDYAVSSHSNSQVSPVVALPVEASPTPLPSRYDSNAPTAQQALPPTSIVVTGRPPGSRSNRATQVSFERSVLSALHEDTDVAAIDQLEDVVILGAQTSEVQALSRSSSKKWWREVPTYSAALADRIVPRGETPGGGIDLEALRAEQEEANYRYDEGLGWQEGNIEVAPPPDSVVEVQVPPTSLLGSPGYPVASVEL